MNEPLHEREALWAEFLARWPVEKLSGMTLQEYNLAGSDNTFCRWLEHRTESLGSIWGGSSFKFGIYSRADLEKAAPAPAGARSDAQYAWYAKYGDSRDEAFESVKALVLRVVRAVRAGRLEEIETVDLWPIVKWKIAFLYQDRHNPCVLPIFLTRYLRAAYGDGAPKRSSDLYRGLLSRRGDEHLVAFADRLFDDAKSVQEGLDRQVVLEHFQAADNLQARLAAAGATQAFLRSCAGAPRAWAGLVDHRRRHPRRPQRRPQGFVHRGCASRTAPGARSTRSAERCAGCVAASR